MKKQLGQFMTPTPLANLVARELGACDAVIDFAVGDGSLLKAVSERLENRVQLFGFDVDKRMVAASRAALGNATVRHSDGLRARVFTNQISGRLGIVGNPPFTSNGIDASGWVQKAFPDIKGKKGVDRAEIQFLARALVLGRQAAARVVLVMPIGFADGDTYRQIRASLMRHYRLIKCIEITGTPFQDTEARTVVLVIDAASTGAGATEISEFDSDSKKTVRIAKETLLPGTRLDARFHKVQRLGAESVSVQLKDLKVSITRGLFSRKEAELQRVIALHTSDLAKASAGKLSAKSGLNSDDLARHVVAKKGDILLPRTGSRVSWSPVVLQAGRAPITDHVFRIRAPSAVRDVVYRSFLHPSFIMWLNGVSKGVCATVLTKRELLEMPVFALQESVTSS